ncbi:MAG: hypothetical protein JOY93_08915 [Acidobacteriales bacterium]|nr:hypothetical protein [Terriglobales bacterium]
MTSEEIRRNERWLATARVLLAVAALVAVSMERREIQNSPWVAGLLAFYFAQSVVIMLLLRRRQRSTASFRWLVHSADIIWPGLISVFTTGQSNPFFLFFVFVLAAAAYRWGLWETLGTAVASVVLLWIEALAIRLGAVAWLDGAMLRHGLPILQVDVVGFEPRHLFMRSIYLVVMGLLLGYLAEQEKQLRAEKAVIAGVLGRVRVEVGLTGTLQEITGEMLRLYGARQAVITSQETSSNRVYTGELSRLDEGSLAFRWLDPSPSDAGIYLRESEASTCCAFRTQDNNGHSFRILGLDREGVRVRNIDTQFLQPLARRHEFRSLAMVSFTFGKEWRGRIFLLDPSLTGDTEEELRFLQELVRQIGPAVYNVYLLRRLRLWAGAVERARFARELHDGAVQSLIAVEMQVDVLRRQSGANGPAAGVLSPGAPSPGIPSMTNELGRIQGLLREEVLKLRELMQQMKSLDLDSRRLLAFLTDTVERFQRETGISARFLAEVQELDMPQPVCRELARIVQEALVNVRKHSGARHVLVRLGSRDGTWNLMIEDDGSGFPFAGRLSQAQLDNLGKGPAVIGERVRLIEGELTVESSPGQGTRLEISVPRQRETAYG